MDLVSEQNERRNGLACANAVGQPFTWCTAVVTLRLRSLTANNGLGESPSSVNERKRLLAPPTN